MADQFVDEEGVTHKLSPLQFKPGDIRDVHAPFTLRYICPSCVSIRAKLVGTSGHWGTYACDCGAEFMVKEDWPAQAWRAKG